MLRTLGDEVATVAALKERFGAQPMCLHVKDKFMEHDGKKDHLVLFKYDQIKTKFAEYGNICREARGIILRMGSWDIVCYPFDKFFNATEKYADDVDWSASVVQEKLDGSLIKVWYNTVLETWVISTNGMIDARDAITEGGTTFCDLFREAAEASGLDYSRLDRSRTYCFELLHPNNTVVIYHPRPRLVHIGTRDMVTLAEVPDDDIGIEKPTVFPLSDLAACQLAASALPETCEGYVVVDRSSGIGAIRRVKIKSPKYVAFHHLGDKSAPLVEVCATVLLAGEEPELQAYGGSSYVRDASSTLLELRSKYDELLKRLEKLWAEAAATIPQGGQRHLLKKHFAQTFQSSAVPKAFFAFLMVRANQFCSGDELRSFDTLVRAHFEKRGKRGELAGHDAKAFVALVRSSWEHGGA